MSQSPEVIIGKFGRTEPRTYGRFKVYTLGDERPKIDRPYLLKGIIYKGDLIFITGDPGSGKTTLAQYIALALAQERSVFGRRVRKGKVFYCALEGKDLFLIKLSVFERAYGTSTNFVYVTQSMRLIENAPHGEDADLLVQMVKDEGADVVFFDTWSKLLAGQDEKTHEVVSAVISVLDRVREETGVAAVVIAHPNRTDKGSVSGSFTTVKDCDALIVVEGTEGVRTVRAAKLRFDQIGPLFSFKLNRVVIGRDSDDEEVTSVDLEEVLDEQPGTTIRPSRRLPAGVEEALKWFREAVDDHGQVGALGAPRRAKAVTIENWKDIAKKRAKHREPDALRKQVDRAFSALVAANRIQAKGDAIWLLKE